MSVAGVCRPPGVEQRMLLPGEDAVVGEELSAAGMCWMGAQRW